MTEAQSKIPESVQRKLRNLAADQPAQRVEGQPYVSYLDESSADFDRHWSDNDLPEIPPAKMELAAKFLEPLRRFLAEQELGKATILDAGCGDGVHTAYLPEQGSAQQCIGLDISSQALCAAARRDSGGWTYVHGDAGDIPLLDDAVDASFSFGVLAYTDDPRKSFVEMVRVTRPGGLIGIWILPDDGSFALRVLKLLRKICRLTGPVGTRFIANCIVPTLFFIPSCSGMHLGNSSWKQCREVVLVDLAPDQLFFPKPDEVRSWFKEAGIEILEEDRDQPVTLWGVLGA